MRQQQAGVVYATTGDYARGTVVAYHHKPQPIKLNKAKKSDVKGLKPKERERLILEDNTDEVISNYTIGFEVEKNELHRHSVREYELFCGFERDSSCGYEAVTHILPLLPAGTWRTKVFDMFHKAERIIDDRWSPSDKRCGGHITVGVDGLDGGEIKRAVRPYCGILYAMFRNRLANTYCCGDKCMTDEYGTTKYQTAYVKGYVLEFRIPSRFDSVRQMMRRYELFYELIDYSINVKGKHESFLKKIKPIVLSMYNGDEAKVDEIMKLAKHFQKYILTGERHEDIRAFV